MQEFLDIGIIGLAVMGRSLALNMADRGFQVGGYNRSREVTETVVREHPHDNFHPFYQLDKLTDMLIKPRKVFLMVQAGKAVDAVLEQLAPLLEPGDIVMDGGNSYFEDTVRRSKELEKRKIRYFGVGVSGGELGARFGPSMMPGGDREAYRDIQPILEAIAAKAKGQPCCAYIGPDGAGHYVKMVHNGIEYADMQLIAEAYLLLKYPGGYSNAEMAGIFRDWNQGELNSYLIGITADILEEKDDFEEGLLLDYILDSAKQKGTGRWTSIEALRQGVDVSMITSACNARLMSNRVDKRREAAEYFQDPPVSPVKDREAFAGTVREGLYAAKILAYAQGFSLMRDASQVNGWNLDYGKIASIFRAGCIIQAEFLNEITQAFDRNENLDHLLEDSYFAARVQENQSSLREALMQGIQQGIPMPAMGNAAAYLDAYRGMHMGANLIQAQRDCFGAHTYERIDREGSFHHDWGKTNE